MDVHIGSDGWLFLVGGSNDVLQYYCADGFFDAAAKLWLAKIRTRVDRAAAMGARYHHMTIPDKLTVMAQHYRGNLPFAKQAPTRALPRIWAHTYPSPQPPFVDVLPFFEQRASKGAKLYWKTDSHWTFEGAYSAYQVYCHVVGATANVEILTAPTSSAELLLDLGRKVAPPIREEYITKKFLRDAKRVFANSMVEFKESTGRIDEGGLHLGSHVVFSNSAPTADPRRVLVFGDSYSEYRTHQLTGILAETFAETHFIWSPNIDWTYAASVKPDLILTEMAERFMNVVPADDLNIEEFSDARLSAFKASIPN